MATDDYWIDTGNPQLYRRANLDLLDGSRLDHSCIAVHDRAHVDPSASIEDSIVGEHATVGAHATVSNSVVLPDAVVEHDAVVANSVVMGRIGERAKVVDSVIGLRGRVDAGEVVSGELRPSADDT
jgi:NDP-sugar pyrophosphorylase family protein